MDAVVVVVVIITPIIIVTLAILVITTAIEHRRRNIGAVVSRDGTKTTADTAEKSNISTYTRIGVWEHWRRDWDWDWDWSSGSWSWRDDK